MTHKLSLSYSPCPNDTYIFYALAHAKIDMGEIEFDIRLNDVEALNQAAREGAVDVSKLSFAAIGHLLETYGLLRSGAALGWGCGPLIVGRKGSTIGDLAGARIAVPGLWTTANLLLGLFCGAKPRIFPMTFDEIMPAVSSGAYDFGVIIHEGRFTYQNYGLENLLDLGAWWESETSLPIPLGGIAMLRTFPAEIIARVESGIRESIGFAHRYPEKTQRYVRANARELSDAVTRQHISLYVNEFSIDIGDQGAAAIQALFTKAREKGLMPESKQDVFALPFFPYPASDTSI